MEKLKRIDDFEMIHLNMIDLQEQIAENNGQKTSMEKNNTKIDEEKLLRGFKSYGLDEFKLDFGVISAKFKKSRD